MKRLMNCVGVIACAAAVVVAVGCSGSKRERTLTTGVSSMNSVSTMLETVSARIDSTYDAMNQLQVQGVDHQAAAENLARHVTLLNQSADAVRDEARRMRSLGDAYFIEWEREHARGANADPDTVSVSRAERESYQRVMDAMDMAGGDFRELSEALRGLQVAVADGFTQEEISPLVQRTNMRAIDARNSIAALQAEFARITANYRMQDGR